MRRALLIVLLTLAAAPPEASAQSASRTDAALAARGTIVVAFASDPATCGPVGRCGISGTVTWHAPRRADLVMTVLPGAGSAFGGVGFGGIEELIAERVTSRVQRATPDGPRTCTDRQDVVGSMDLARTGRAVRLAFDRGLDLFETRCGAPLRADVDAALPRITTSVRALRSRRLRLDLRGRRAFRGGGFAGTVRSSLVLRSTSSQTGRRPLLPDILDLPEDWRVERVDGRVELDAEPPAGCAALDSCDLVTTLTVAPAAGPGSGGFRGGFGALAWEGGSVSIVAGRGGSEPCRDTLALPATLITFTGRGDPVRAELAGDGIPRTRCPGPLFGLDDESPLAGAPLARGALVSDRFTVTLDRPAVVGAGGTRIRSRPALTVAVAPR